MYKHKLDKNHNPCYCMATMIKTKSKNIQSIENDSALQRIAMFGQKLSQLEGIKPELAAKAQHIGLTLMTLAALGSVVEVPEHGAVSAQLQPAFATAHNPQGEENTGSRERKETGPEYVSYGNSQRTPGRSGTH